MQKIMFSTGEASGDMHGARVAAAIRQISPEARLLGMGGREMRAAGVDIIYDIADLGVIGLVEVMRNLPRFFALRDKLGEVMDEEKPDVLVVIDYAEFNMRLAKVAKKKGIPVVYYISPSVWIWRRGRAKELAKTVEEIAAIFPFEAEVYEAAGAKATLVGHPLLDIVKPAREKEAAYSYFAVNKNQPLVLLMPGSRKQEIVNLLPIMLAAAEIIRQKRPDCQFLLPLASTISREMIGDIVSRFAVSPRITTDNIYDLMQIADVGMAASGTVTLEAALMNLPTVVIYKLAPVTWFIGKMFVTIPYVSLPNMIAGRQVVPELLQHDATPEHVADETLRVIENKDVSVKMRQDLREVREKLGATGAVRRTAELILAVADKKNGGQP